MKQKQSETFGLVQKVTRLLDDKKAGDLTVLDVSAQSSITDYLVIATATSEPHLRALRVELEKLLDSDQVHLVGMETAQESGWFIIDAFDVMIHLFLPQPRERYGLERLWRDATEVSVSKLLEKKATPTKPRKKAAAATPKPRRKRPSR